MTAAPHVPVIVALDTQLAVGTATGIGVYQRDLVRALRNANTDVRPLNAPWLDPWRFDRRILWDQVLLPFAAARSGATLLHASAGTMPFIRTLPTIVTVHDLAWHRVQSHTRPYARTYFGKLQAAAYEHAAAVICDSNFSATEYRELIEPHRTVDVVYPGVDERFAHIERRPDASPFALVVGTVEARKNLLILVEALPSLPTLRIVAVGPHTPYADVVRARAAALNVADRVELRGQLAHQQAVATAQAGTLFVLPSVDEAFGVAYVEAMAAGVPAIGCRGEDGPEEIAGAGPGIAMVPPRDPPALATQIDALLTDRAGLETIGRQARETAQRAFTWARCGHETVQAYRDVLNGL